MLRPNPARNVRRRRARAKAAWAALLALIGPAVAAGQDRGGMPPVTPSPMNTTPPAGPRVVEAPPPPPAPGPAPGAPRVGPTEPALTSPSGTRVVPRMMDLRTDSTGFVPDRPPGPPVPGPPGEVATKVGELIDVVGEAEAEIDVVVGRSRLVQTRDPLTRIAIANPAIADFQLINDQPNTRLLNLYGLSYGTTDLTIWDAKGRPTTFVVRVTIDTRDLQSRLKQVFPGADVRIRQASSQIILEGQVPDVKTMAEVLQLVAAELRIGQGAGGGAAGGGGGAPGGGAAPTGMAGGGGGGGAAGGGGAGMVFATAGVIINRVRVPGPRQVILHVKIAELNRTAIREIGVNFLDLQRRTVYGSQIGTIAPMAASAAGPPRTLAGAASISSNSQLFGIFNAGEFSVFLNALRQNSLAKIIAEPTLVTLDGQPARFLAGGQFPYPVPQIASSGGGNVVTIQFAPFGALVSFLPNILAGDVIRLDVEPAFSELNFATGTSVNGTSVPGINQRSARTVVELREGQTLAIAGLLQTQTSASTARLPFLGDMPIVGTAFSRSVINTVETELVVLVTPELVNPMEQCDVPVAAADRVIQPNDFEFYVLGRIEGKTGKDFRATVREMDVLDVMKHFRSEGHYVVGPHGYMD